MIEGGKPLSGSVVIQGAKNAALPIMAASLLAEGTTVLENVPNLLDITVMTNILREIGCKVVQDKGTIYIDTTQTKTSHVPEDLMSRMRSSIFLMGPLLAKYGKTKLYKPGGCAIGERKIDIHLDGLRALGATIEEEGDAIVCSAEQLTGADIHLSFPSVGATENIMMAAVLAKGRTVITNAAREPEIQDLQNFLNAMGAKVLGAGTDTITIDGVERLFTCEHRIIPDRIVTGTLIIAAAATRGQIILYKTQPAHLTSLINVIRKSGVQILIDGDIIKVDSRARVKAVDKIVTAPYPAFPTDLQSQMMVMLSLASGTSIMKETIFESRLKHVDELARMGADIRVDMNTAFIRGVPRLYGATVEATDLRAGAALVIAGLAAQGRTIVEKIHHIDRGYDHIEDILSSLGAKIVRVTSAVSNSEINETFVQ